MYLDLDINSGNISVPGCMTACVMSKDSHYATVPPCLRSLTL